MKLEYNSTYVSLNLIDELDYVIGGYGKPDALFLYSLNTFLQAFVFNSNFYISQQEARHMQIVSKAMFPEGRPIAELIAKSQSLSAIGGIGNDIAVVVSLGQFDPNNPTSYQERIEHYINHGLETEETRKKYLVIPSIEKEVKDLKYLNIGRVEDGWLATESSNSPESFFKKLSEITKDSNVQACLPFYSYQFQLNNIQSRGISREIISKLSDSFESKQDQVEKYFGRSNQTIPPLVSILLSQCKGIEDLPDKILQLREDFTKLRESVVKYEKRLYDATNIKDQFDAMDELNEFWSFLNKKYTGGEQRLLYKFWEVAEESGYEKSIDDAIDTRGASEMLEDLNLGKVAGKGTKKIVEWYREKKIINRFRGVTDIWSLFQSAPNVNKQIQDFERVFNVQLEKEDLVRLNAKLKELKLHTTAPKPH